MLSYKEITKIDGKLREFTNLSTDTFEQLAELSDVMLAFRIKRKALETNESNKNEIFIYENSPFKNREDRLLFYFVHMKDYASYEFLSFLYDLPIEIVYYWLYSTGVSLRARNRLPKEVFRKEDEDTLKSMVEIAFPIVSQIRSSTRAFHDCGRCNAVPEGNIETKPVTTQGFVGEIRFWVEAMLNRIRTSLCRIISL